MNSKPILFSAPMVRAILEGKKTMTRRILKPQPFPDGDWLAWAPLGRANNKPFYTAKNVNWNPITNAFWDFWSVRGSSPFGAPGDRLWVRETFGLMPTDHDFEKWVVYRADETAHRAGIGEDETVNYRPSDPALLDEWTPRKWNGPAPKPWKPSIFMPRWASRITLEVTSVRVERLQDISEEDARAEGIQDRGRQDGAPYPHFHVPGGSLSVEHEAVPVYAQLWESINGPGSWEANPWVWCLSFRRVEP